MRWGRCLLVVAAMLGVLAAAGTTAGAQLTLEPGSGDACEGTPTCFVVTQNDTLVQDEVLELLFKNTDNATHGVWIQDAANRSGSDGNQDEALVGTGPVDPGAQGVVEFTVPADVEALYLWSDVADDEQRGMNLTVDVQPPEEPEETPSAFDRANNTFVGEEVAFTLDPDLPGIRNLRDRTTSQVLFETVRLEGTDDVQFKVHKPGYDTIVLSAKDGRGQLMVEDGDPPPIRAWFGGSDRVKGEDRTWRLSVGEHVTVRRVQENADGLLVSSYPTYYELGLGGDRVTYLVGTHPRYDASERTFAVTDLSLVYQADRVTVEADEARGCGGDSTCLRFQGFRGNPDPGETVRFRFENEGNSTHSLWVADNEVVAGDRPNASTSDAIAGTGPVAPGEVVSLDVTVPEGAEGFFVWCDRPGHALDGGYLRWNWGSGGFHGGEDPLEGIPDLGFVGMLVAGMGAALASARP